MITPRFVRESKLHVANVLLSHQERCLQSVRAREFHHKQTGQVGRLVTITLDLWDETGQHMQMTKNQANVSEIPGGIPLLREYLNAKAKGASTTGMVMSIFLHKAWLKAIDIDTGCVLCDEPVTAPLQGLLSKRAETLYAALTQHMPLPVNMHCPLRQLAGFAFPFCWATMQAVTTGWNELLY